MIVRLLLAVTIAWGTLAFGGVYEWAYRPLLVMALVTGLTASAVSGTRRLPVAIVCFAAASAIAIGMQLVPVEATVLAAISPGTHRVLEAVDLGYATGQTHHPFSVSPSLTAIGLLFLGCLTVFTVGLSQWLTQPRLRYLAWLLVILGAGIAIEALVQRMLSPTLVYGQPALIYGFWKPFSGRDPFGPFVNKNHFAGWMLMAIPTAIGLSTGLLARSGVRRMRSWHAWFMRLSDPGIARAMFCGFCALVMTVGLSLSLSRSGLASVVIALTIGAVVSTRNAGRSDLTLTVAAAIGALVVAAITWAGVDAISNRFAALNATDFDARLAIWRDTWRMAQEAPWTGVGIRGYSTASLAYQTALPDLHVSAAHSDWLQLAAEGGCLVGLPALGLLVALTIEGARRFRAHRSSNDFGTTYWIRAGAATGLLGIGLQSLVEFSLQMPGNTVLFAALWAVVIAPVAAAHGGPTRV